jgi:hypothetical protein
MNFTIENFNFSKKAFALLFHLYCVAISLTNASPAYSRESSLVNQCCMVHSYSRVHKLGKMVTPEHEMTPGKGKMVHLYKTLSYGQRINTEICKTNPRAEDPDCGEILCRNYQSYTKQSVIVKELHHRSKPHMAKIWVADGCR